jgi:NADH dehydrogenase
MVYELGGPHVYSYKALVQLVLAQVKLRRVLMPVPYIAWEILAALMALLPNPPLSRDQVKLMKTDNVVSADALTMIDLGIEPTPVATILPMYLGERAGEPSN